jgi:hypothetical protein
VLALMVPSVFGVACQSVDRRTPAPSFVRAGSTAWSQGGASSGGDELVEPRERSAGVKPASGTTFDHRLLPPPGIGGWMPMEAEAFLSPQSPQSPEATTRRDGTEAQEPGHWSGLPLMGDLAREHDVRLPVPVGVSVNYSAINRPSNVDRVQAGVNGGPLVELPSLDFEADAEVQIVIGRVDAWILPMLDVYVLGGYVWNESSVDVTVDLPGAPDTTFTANGNLEGPTYGFGTTLAGGYGRYFMLADFNWNKVELGGLSEMDAVLGTARVGYSTTDLDWIDELRVYLAATYWDTARTISGSLQTMGGLINSIEYAVDQSPVDPWTVGFGVHLGFNRYNSIILEAQGYDDTFYFVGGFMVRI